jgi:hypothetical protein
MSMHHTAGQIGPIQMFHSEWHANHLLLESFAKSAVAGEAQIQQLLEDPGLGTQ